jgi:ubiquinone/menaquinone biosynthesis C-methylase UbiE
MNLTHSGVTDWGLSRVTIRPHDTILDVGCGGGRTIAKLASMAPTGRIYGVDYSATSVAAARRRNRAAVASGRVEIVEGSVSSLPFGSGMFDLVTAVETHYYWPDLTADLREILRVLAPGGSVVVIAEAYRGGKHDAMLRRLDALQAQGIMPHRHYTVDEHRTALVDAGYTAVDVAEDYARGWLCAVGRRRDS